MPKAKITNTFTRVTKVPLSTFKVLYSDIKDIGFVLEIRSSGTKTFYYRYNLHNKTYYKKLGTYPSVDANKARALVIKLKHNKESKKCISLESLSKNNTITLEKFYHDKYVPFLVTAKKSYRSDFNYFKTHILPNFGNYPMDTITKAAI